MDEDKWMSVEVRERVDELGRRFQGAIVVRLARRASVLKSDATASDVDEAVRNWLGAAAEELLMERNKSGGWGA